MAYDHKLAARVRTTLQDRADVTEGKMIGSGRSFLLGGKLCCAVSKDALMVRVGPEDYEGALSEPHVRPLSMGGKSPKGFVLVDPEGIGSKESLTRWVHRACDFVQSLSK